MSLAEDYRADRKARLIRLGALPYQAPVISVEKSPVKPQANDAGWEGMWFYDLLKACKEPRQTVPIREIQAAVCKHYGLSSLDLLSQRRTKDINRARQVAMYLCRTLSTHSFAELARRFGGRDHTTIIHGAQKIEGLLGYDMKVTCDVNSIKKVLA